jgi:hypothetical protein
MTDDTGGAQAERSGRRQRRARLGDITMAGLFLLLLASSLANLYLRREANRIKKDRPVMARNSYSYGQGKSTAAERPWAARLSWPVTRIRAGS